MTTTHIAVDDTRARAYCGPAHGHSWVLDTAGDPPSAVEFGEGSRGLCYRLVRHPRTGSPARDYWGNYLYMALQRAHPSGREHGASR